METSENRRKRYLVVGGKGEFKNLGSLPFGGPPQKNFSGKQKYFRKHVPKIFPNPSFR
jgi:hypothetical protein